MSTEENRKVADDLFARLSAGDIPGALALLADDVCNWQK
jgi:ketosteroid isomerase-like protein